MTNRPKILLLGGAHDSQIRIRERLGDDVEIVEAKSGIRALAQLSHDEFAAVYVDAEHFSDALQIGQLVRSEKILEGMPDGVVLLDSEKTILWGNGRLSEWADMDNVVGENFYKVMLNPEIIGPEFSPFTRALATGKPVTSNLRCEDNRYFQVHAAPVFEGDGAAEHLVVTVRDVTAQMLQQQKLNAIHEAGVELADLTPDEVARMTVDERIELLKANILHFTKDLLNFDFVEIRLLDHETGELRPLLAVGMAPEAAQRALRAESTGSGVTGFVAATGKSYVCEQTGDDPLYLAGAPDARSSLTTPLIFHDQVIGTFNVESPDPHAFDESDMQFLEIFSRDVAVALNTLEILAAQQATTTVESVEAIHRAVAKPIDFILNDAVNLMDQYAGQDPIVATRLERILRHARDIKQVIHRVGQTMAPTTAKPPSLRANARPKLVGRRILVVDDDDEVRDDAHALLDRYGCIVETAHDGAEAVFMARSLSGGMRYDVIISDIHLPDMDGYDLMVKLRDITDDVPLVLMAGFGWDPGHTVVKARRAGLRYVVFKPFRLSQLIEALEGTIDGPSDSEIVTKQPSHDV